VQYNIFKKVPDLQLLLYFCLYRVIQLVRLRRSISPAKTAICRLCDASALYPSLWMRRCSSRYRCGGAGREYFMSSRRVTKCRSVGVVAGAINGSVRAAAGAGAMQVAGHESDR